MSEMFNAAVVSQARDFYAIYCASADGKNYQGLPCPEWDALTPAVRGHWCTVALRAFALNDAMRGTVPAHIPAAFELAHLPDPAHAESVWRIYVGA